MTNYEFTKDHCIILFDYKTSLMTQQNDYIEYIEIVYMDGILIRNNNTFIYKQTQAKLPKWNKLSKSRCISLIWLFLVNFLSTIAIRFAKSWLIGLG